MKSHREEFAGPFDPERDLTDDDRREARVPVDPPAHRIPRDEDEPGEESRIEGPVERKAPGGRIHG